jgi:hypothetical protein
MQQQFSPTFPRMTCYGVSPLDSNKATWGWKRAEWCWKVAYDLHRLEQGVLRTLQHYYGVTTIEGED